MKALRLGEQVERLLGIPGLPMNTIRAEAVSAAVAEIEGLRARKTQTEEAASALLETLSEDDWGQDPGTPIFYAPRFILDCLIDDGRAEELAAWTEGRSPRGEI